jgi:CspA family cold shock protein
MRGSALPTRSTSAGIGIPKTGGRNAHTDLAQIAGSAYVAGVDPFGFGFTAGVPSAGLDRVFRSNRRSIRRTRLRRPDANWSSKLMATGTVKWFNAQKGYGFIQPTSGGPDVFVHISAVERAGMDGLDEGQKLSYDLEQGQRGRVSAVNLRPD